MTLSTICKYKELLEEETKPQRTLSENAQSTSHTSSIPFLNQNSNQTSQEINTTTFVPNHSESQPMTVSNHTESQSMAQPMTIFMSNFYHRLPKLDLPTFSGDILAWQIFWDSFQTTVNNPSLTNVQKFSYLKSQLNHSAEYCIPGLALTSANYEQEINLLKERFGNEPHC